MCKDCGCQDAKQTTDENEKCSGCGKPMSECDCKEEAAS